MRHKVGVSLGKRFSTSAAPQRIGPAAASYRWQVGSRERYRRAAGVSPGKHLDSRRQPLATHAQSTPLESPLEPVKLLSFYDKRALRCHGRWGSEGRRPTGGVSPGKHLGAGRQPGTVRTRCTSLGSPRTLVRFRSIYDEGRLSCHRRRSFEGRGPTGGVSPGKHLDALRQPGALRTQTTSLGSPPAPVNLLLFYGERRLRCHGHRGFEGPRPTGGVSPGKHLLTSSKFNPPARGIAVSWAGNARSLSHRRSIVRARQRRGYERD